MLKGLYENKRRSAKGQGGRLRQYKLAQLVRARDCVCVNPEVVSSIPVNTQNPKTQIYMDLSHIGPQARMLNYFFK